MVKKCATLVALLLITTFVHIPDAALAITTFNASSGGSASFSGDSTKFLQVTNETTTSLNMADSNDFTIAWWQNSIVVQSPYPRILQFGHGHEYENKFAISEEYDNGWDRIILWINGMMITNIINPNPESSAWHHIAITRNGNDFSWFIDGVFLYSVNNEVENFNTSNLDLLIGSGDDQGTGGFSGNLAGVQISKSVRWETATVFTPPIDFQNPGSGLAFSMYVSQSAVIDKSGNNLVVLPKPIGMGGPTDFIEFLDDFNPPNLTPTPTAPDSPTSVSATDGEDASTTVSWTAPVSDGGSAITEYNATTESGQTCTSNDTECRITGLTNGSAYTFTVTASNEIGTSAPSSASASITPTSPIPIDWSQYPSKIRVDYPGQNAFLWGSELSLYKDDSASASAFDFDLIEHISIGVPVTYLDSNEDPVETICFLEVTDSGVDESKSELWFELWQFHYLIFDLIGSTCDGNLIPDYQHGMFGETQTAMSIYLWTQENVTDFSEVEEAFEELQINMLLPPHISGLSITRGNNVETNPGRISFGDTLTIAIANDAAMSEIAMVFHIPEAYSDEDGVGSEQNVCFYNPISDNNIDQRIFALPTLEGLLTVCRAQYDGDWEFDLYAERMFSIVAFDEAANLNPTGVSPLILNPVITVDWSQYPSTIDFPWSDFPVWGTTYDIYKDESAPAFDFNRIKHVSIGVPVTYLDSSAIRVNTMCYVKISSSDIDVNSDNELELDLLSFDDLALDELQGCSDDIPDYQHGMLGETQTALSVYLWTQETFTVLTDVASAFEVLHVNVNLPPEILGHTITRMSNTDLDTQRLYSGDTIHLSFANSQNTSEMFWSVNLPEAFRIGDSPNNNTWCYLWIEADTNGVFLESVTVPSSSQIYSHCHGENFYPGDWTYDESVSRSIRIFAEDLEGNGIGYPRVDSPLTLAARVQNP
jgi:hypothetical protein